MPGDALNGPPRLANEIPFRPHRRFRREADLLHRLGLTRLSQGAQQACLSLVANLMYTALHETETWVFYSRDKNHYAAHARIRRYRPSFYTWRKVTHAVAALEDAGLIEHRKTAPSPQAKYRSRIRAKPVLIGQLSPLHVTDFTHDRREVIVLRDSQGKHAPYGESRDIKRLRNDVLAQNHHLSLFSIDIDHLDAVCGRHGLLRIGAVCLDPQNCTYHRVFNQNFSRGGRWYGPFWQSLPARIRKGLRMNGMPTIEIDFRACHLRLLASVVGLNLPFDDPDYDPYLVPGFPRPEIKLAFNIMLNASSPRSAQYALADELSGGMQSSSSAYACALMAAVERQFPALAQFWNADVGIRLQNVDAKICTSVQKRLRRAGIPALSIHDSFVVPQADEARLRFVMAEEMDRMCLKLAQSTKL